MDCGQQRPALVSVVILNHNGTAIIDVVRRSVGSILGQDYPHTELILVDDNSTDGSDLEIAAICQQVGATYLSTRNGNHGICAARNRALASASGQYVVFLDNDALPLEGWLSALVRFMDANPRVGACASRVMFADKPDIVNSMGSVLNELFHGNGVCAHELFEFASWPDEVMYATGNGMMLRKSAIEQVGPFDEGFLFYTPDDADYGMRLRRAGWCIAPVPDAPVLHLHSFSKTQQGMGRWDGRNRIRLALKHLSWREMPRFVVLDLCWNARPEILKEYLWYWWSTLTDRQGVKALVEYRRRHRGEPSYARMFERWFSSPERLTVVPDNRAFGKEMVPLRELRMGVDEEPYLYHGWYWVEQWGETPMRWAARVASLAGSLPDGARALRWRLLPRPGGELTALSVIVGRREAVYEEIERLDIELEGGSASEPVEVVTPCELFPGDYRFVLRADRALVEPGPFPRRIGFGLASLVVESSVERA